MSRIKTEKRSGKNGAASAKNALYPKRARSQSLGRMNFDVVVVLGMHRSGTSALTKALELFGIDLGTDLLPPQDDNPKGFFEDRGLVS